MNIQSIDRDDLIHIRGLLMTLAGHLSEVLSDGLPEPPKKSRSREDWRDAMSAYEEWHECRWQTVRDAEAFLKETEGWT